MTDKINVRQLPVIGLYREENGEVEFKYRFAKEEYKGKDNIINYMKNAIIYGARPEVLYDTFTNEQIPYESLLMTDGNFRWSSELLYYVEKYNLILPKNFTDIIDRDKTVKVSKDDLE